MSSLNDESKVVINQLSEVEVEVDKGPINIQPGLMRLVKIKSPAAREFLAELFGCFIFLTFGLAGVAQYKFQLKDNPYNTNFLAVHVGFGFGIVAAILCVGKISGAHLNPAVSLAMLLTGRMNFKRFFVYFLGQLIGSFLAAFIVFLVYIDALKAYPDGMYSLDLAGIFATYPNDKVSVFGGFFDQLMGTALLITVVLAITDKRNVEIPHGTVAILVGLTIFVIGDTLGYNGGYAINPTRDLGPRLFTLIAGWGSQTFTAGSYYFWIPIVAPMIGSVIATFIYTIIISNNL